MRNEYQNESRGVESEQEVAGSELGPLINSITSDANRTQQLENRLMDFHEIWY
jgi:hypothetical protein